MRISIRKAEPLDLKRVYQIEKRSYPPQLQATKKILDERFETFGIWVAELDGLVVGFFTCVPAKIGWSNMELSEFILKNRNPNYRPWFDKYKKGNEFNTLWVTSTAVETAYQNRGVGKCLVSHSLRLSESLGLDYRASALRCQYASYYKAKKGSIWDYLAEIIRGELKDRFLNLYLNLGFTLLQPLKNYEPNKGSRDYNILAFKKLS
jgi:GNAT superfamily N-acetyltransferase